MEAARFCMNEIYTLWNKLLKTRRMSAWRTTEAFRMSCHMLQEPPGRLGEGGRETKEERHTSLADDDEMSFYAFEYFSLVSDISSDIILIQRYHWRKSKEFCSQTRKGITLFPECFTFVSTVEMIIISMDWVSVCTSRSELNIRNICCSGHSTNRNRNVDKINQLWWSVQTIYIVYHLTVWFAINWISQYACVLNTLQG